MTGSRQALVIMLVVTVVLTLLVLWGAPTWVVLMVGSVGLALIYIIARMHSRYDPLDPRFGSCIPPLPRPRDHP